jgi:hypothetical protein
LVVTLVGSLMIGGASAQEDVIRRVIEGVKGGVKPATAPSTETKPDEGAVEVPRAPAVQLGPKFIRLHLQDGSVISGDLSISEIALETQFGKLVIPIDKIRSFTPGLDANTKLDEQIQALIKDLGSDDYKTREQSHKDLAAMGRKVQKELEKYTADENAEIKRHVTEILKELEEAAEETDVESGSSPGTLIARLDTVVTSDFTVLGRVAPGQFEIQSKYGPLTIQLADIARGERQVGEPESLRKALSINAANLAQRGFKNTGIRVQAGDRISIKAEGTLTLTPWGNNAQTSPDGIQNYGWYIPGQIPTGALCARVGDKGTPFKVGSNHTFVARQAGVLQLAIGMQQEYANEGYQFPGEFKVRLRIDPK